jgi:hypothetical protein
MKSKVTIYQDTPAGAKLFIQKESSLKITKKTKITADPYVEGVWKLTNLSDSCLIPLTAVIEMAGYKAPFGDIRDHNDFETFI